MAKLSKNEELSEYLENNENQNHVSFLPPPSSRLIVKRDGHSMTKKIPKPIVLIVTGI